MRTALIVAAGLLLAFSCPLPPGGGGLGWGGVLSSSGDSEPSSSGSLAAARLFLSPPPRRGRGQSLKVGFAECDITPALGVSPVYLAGFGLNRAATGVRDALKARAVALSDGKTRLAFVSADVIGLFLPTVEAIRARVPGCDYLAVCATHNHDGPDTMGLWGPNPLTTGRDAAYMAKLEAACAEVANAALASLADAAAEVSMADLPHLLVDNRLPEVKHDRLTALRFRAPGGKVLGDLVQWNCHPETLGSKNKLVSSDFVSPLAAAMAAESGAPCVYFTGTVGGLLTSLGVPVDGPDGKRLPEESFEKSDRFGRLVAGAALGALKKPTAVELTPFAVRTERVFVPVENQLYQFAWTAKTLKRELHAPPVGSKQPARLGALAPGAGLVTEVGLVTLGEVQIAMIPGEIYSEQVLGKYPAKAEPGADFPDAPLEPAILPAMRSKFKLLFGLANDELGYFVPKRQWDAAPPYAYGRKKPQYGEQNSVGPEAARLVGEAFARLAGG